VTSAIEDHKEPTKKPKNVHRDPPPPLTISLSLQQAEPGALTLLAGNAQLHKELHRLVSAVYVEQPRLVLREQVRALSCECGMSSSCDAITARAYVQAQIFGITRDTVTYIALGLFADASLRDDCVAVLRNGEAGMRIACKSSARMESRVL
jgi:hypothetical protein